VIPVVLGDTIMTSIVPAAWMFSRREKSIQVEAGLRSMAPEVMQRYKEVDAQTFIDQQFYGKWMLLRNEPFPEQWDTFTSAASSEFLFAPVGINRDHLIREGYPDSNIWTVGGVVVDAMDLKLKEKPKQSIFSVYPQLEKGQWVRMDIHRRDNLSPQRFKAIIGAIELLVKKGYNVNFVEMNATKTALDRYGLRHEIEKLSKYGNFLHTGVWPEYSNVVEFYSSEHCLAALTDSGGIQEEMNVLGKPCMTCRFNTDRPETVNDAKSNILVPAIDKEFIMKIADSVLNNDSLQKSMRQSRKLYGKNVGSEIMNVVGNLESTGNKPFKWAHEALGLWNDTEDGIDYL
ncbi:UDP-N-acetylglucosamine 2-epimerase, partial [Candidatus Woesearchaeota archaeon]|nr:UDP-N-acetylglucosamine 2-epimerase [Candidatus Woesearchaeota archaeon]